VIIALASDETAAGSLASVLIGATVFVGALVTGPLTGGSFNPARSLGPAILSGQWTAHWLYWLAPIAGMVGVMRLYEFLRPAENAGTNGVAIDASRLSVEVLASRSIAIGHDSPPRSATVPPGESPVSAPTL